MREKTYKKNTILYGQGFWAVRVERDNGNSICYEPLEHSAYPIGTLFDASKDLFKEKRDGA